MYLIIMVSLVSFLCGAMYGIKYKMEIDSALCKTKIDCDLKIIEQSIGRIQEDIDNIRKST